MCETRDLGIKWTHWHRLSFSEETRIDMRFVFSSDVSRGPDQRIGRSGQQSTSTKS